MTGASSWTSPAAYALEGASWITSPDDSHLRPGGRPGYEFLREFSSGEMQAADLVITAHGIYEAFINGQRVGSDELTPGLTSYHSTLTVQRFAVGSLLRAGTNELRVVVSDGWFRGRTGASRIADHFGAEIGVIALLSVHTTDGVVEQIATGPGWKVGVGAIQGADLMDGQKVDFRRAVVEDWADAPVLDTGLTRDVDRLVFSDAPATRQTAEYPPKSITRLASGRQIVDFGTTVNGWVRLRRLGPEGTQTDLLHGEWLLPDGDLDREHAAYTQWPVGGLLTIGQHDSVVSRGNDSDVFEPRHTTHGFRYVAIDGRDDDLLADDISAVMVRSDLATTASFRTGDSRIDRLHEISVQSWLVNSCEVPTDCPQRERWGYTGDYQIFVHTAAFLEDVDLFSRRWLRSLADDQHESGLITNVAPVCGVDPILPDLDGAAGWGDAATVVPWELYRAYGDVNILEENIGMMTRWVNYVQARARDHRHPSRVDRSVTPAEHEQFIWDTGWQWGEWFEPGHTFDPDGDKGIVATAYLSRSAAIVADSLRALHRADEAAHYQQLATDARQAWQLEFVDATAGRLATDRQANYVRALAFGLLDEEDRSWAIARLVDLIAEAGGHLRTGFLSTGLLLPTLADNGHLDLAYELLRQNTEPSWMTMLDRGATAVWESWSGVDSVGKADASLAHYSKGAVIDFLHEYTAGLRQADDSAGWSKFLIDPRPGGGLDHAELTHDTRLGRIRVAWQRNASGLELSVDVPLGATATVRTPSGDWADIGPGRHHWAG